MPGDIDLYYAERGRGDALILLHGNGEDGSWFVNQIDCFSRYFRVIAVDTRGHGRSPRGTGEFTIARFADDLRDFMDRMDIDRAVLLGYSDGANIAMRFAIRYPERVRALILNGGNLNPRGVKARYQIPIEIACRVKGLRAGRSEKAKRDYELLRLMVYDPNLSDRELETIHVPTLVIAGTRDMIRDAHTRHIARQISGARLRIIEGGHAVSAENPEAFNREVELFLRDCGLIS